jgi:hypothetical protein
MPGGFGKLARRLAQRSEGDEAATHARRRLDALGRHRLEPAQVVIDLRLQRRRSGIQVSGRRRVGVRAHRIEQPGKLADQGSAHPPRGEPAQPGPDELARHLRQRRDAGEEQAKAAEKQARVFMPRRLGEAPAPRAPGRGRRPAKGWDGSRRSGSQGRPIMMRPRGFAKSAASSSTWPGSPVGRDAGLLPEPGLVSTRMSQSFGENRRGRTGVASKAQDVAHG